MYGDSIIPYPREDNPHRLNHFEAFEKWDETRIGGAACIHSKCKQFMFADCRIQEFIILIKSLKACDSGSN